MLLSPYAFSCNKYVTFIYIIIKISTLRNVCLNISYLYITVFTYFYSVVLVKMMGVYCAYILCVFLSLFFILKTVIDVHLYKYL